MNAFEKLGLEPRPWLDAEEVTRRFHERAASTHPDRDGGHTELFAELNTAHAVLREPDSRLKHLLALCYPEFSADRFRKPAEADLFMKIGELLHAANRIRTGLAGAGTPLGRALLAKEAANCRAGIRQMRDVVEQRWEKLFVELQAMDALWPNVPVEELSSLAESFSFLRKWRQQLESVEADLCSG